jgi:hypothetical protein
MTLDEAIKHAEEVAKETSCKPCAIEHKQLAAWLKELKKRKNAAEWEWGEPEAEEEIGLEETYYLNPATEAAAAYLINDPGFSNKTTKWIKDRLQETYYNWEVVRTELINYFMETLVDGAHKLKFPYSNLALAALERVDWDALARSYMAPYGGPQYFTEEEERESLEKPYRVTPPPIPTQRRNIPTEETTEETTEKTITWTRPDMSPDVVVK